MTDLPLSKLTHDNETYELKDSTARSQLANKQDTISDLSSIRSGASAGATALQPNAAITGATKCKITYDSKGLVTAGTDLAASDIPDISATYQTKITSTNKVAASNISGLATVATSGNASDLTQSSSYRLVSDTEKSTWSGKQDTLVSGTNIKTVNNISLLGTGNIDIQGGGSGTVDQTFNGSSTNAQSGVAIAGKLTDDKYVWNNFDSLVSSSAGICLNFGSGSAAAAYGTGIAIGDQTTAYDSSIAFGHHSNAASGSTIFGNTNTCESTSICIGNRNSDNSRHSVLIGNEIDLSDATDGDIIISSFEPGSVVTDRPNDSCVFALVQASSETGELFTLVDLKTKKIPNARIDGLTLQFTTADGQTITVTNGVITGTSANS